MFGFGIGVLFLHLLGPAAPVPPTTPATAIMAETSSTPILNEDGTYLLKES